MSMCTDSAISSLIYQDHGYLGHITSMPLWQLSVGTVIAITTILYVEVPGSKQALFRLYENHVYC